METLVIATSNLGKLDEFKEMFKDLPVTLKCLADYPQMVPPNENGRTFAANAKIKATYYARNLKEYCLADDSGLEVEALGGEPGLFSARYKGLETEHERRLAVLKGLEGSDNRKARFVTCICFIDEAGEEHLFSGVWNGEIAFEEEGTNGFGYDPIFISEDGNGKTTASLPLSFKETYSHRAKAVRKLIFWLQSRSNF